MRRTRTAAEANHFSLFTSLLSAIMSGKAGAPEWRAFMAAQISKGLKIDPDAASPETPDFVILAEARRAVIGTPSLRRWHGAARQYLRAMKGGREMLREGDHCWGVFLSRQEG